MNQDKEPLRVIRLEASNVMGLKAIEYTVDPDGALVIVGGRNGSGKTSTISAIFFALTGKPDVKQPIRNGENEAVIEVDLGDTTGLKIKAIRRFWRNARDPEKIETSLKLQNAEGLTYGSPQSILNDLLTKVSIDPFDFTRKRPAEQAELIRAALRLDTSDLDEKEATARERRKLLKAQLDALEKRNAGLTTHADVPEEEVSVADLTQQLNECNAENMRVAGLKADAEAKAGKLARVDEAIASQQQIVAELEQRLAAAKATLEEWSGKRHEVEKDALASQKVAESTPLLDTAPILRQIEDAEEINRKVRENRQRAGAIAEWKSLEEQRAQQEQIIQDSIFERSQRTIAAVAAAKLAVEGLELREDGPYLGGIPFAQCNTAEQLKLSVALAVKENPRLRVFRIADGEKLEPRNMKVLGQIAADAGAQIWVEQMVTPEDVEGGFREVSILIENGCLREEAKELVGAR